MDYGFILGPVAGAVGGVLGSLPFRHIPLARRYGIAVATVLSVLIANLSPGVWGETVSVYMRLR